MPNSIESRRAARAKKREEYKQRSAEEFRSIKHEIDLLLEVIGKRMSDWEAEEECGQLVPDISHVRSRLRDVKRFVLSEED